jgi:transcriptional regulator with XRE-family HTH domain
MTNLRNVLSTNIKSRRRSLGLTQEKLAERAHTATTYIAMIELEKKFPSVEMLEKIAAALEIDTPQLFSMPAVSAESLKQLKKTVLEDFDKIIALRLKEIDEGHFPAVC